MYRTIVIVRRQAATVTLLWLGASRCVWSAEFTTGT